MKTHLSILLIISFFFCTQAWAGRVVKVKGNKVYIVFNQDELGSFGEDDLFYLLDSKGRKRAIIHIKRVKGTKAIALLRKGKARKRFTTEFRGVGKKTKAKMMAKNEDEESEYEDEAENPSYYKKRNYLGLMVGFGSASQDVNQGSSTSSQSGSSIAVKLAYDYQLFDSVDLRGMLGAELFSVDGSGLIAGTSTQANVGSDITYATLDLLLRWHFFQGSSLSMYLAGGMGVFFPASKESDAIVEDSIDSLVIGEVGIGFDYKLKTMKIPFDISYYYFPSGDDVDTQIISVKTGLLWAF